ncbi:lysylphosphatidylglycerol synthase transmembrane domain-containing protein [Corynebacterium qintianiae]|uniref:lysylphosphatidylglycerol synthase transmembrane domain-containing protein n=1 Tax=Corynebacterium qintianiae TaxID=2709392 RepID=UPI002017F32E|nr:YbhN family protein [Corynebacterium qintianiae]
MKRTAANPVGSSVWRWLRWLAPLVVLALIALIFRGQLSFLGEAWDALLDASPGPVAAAIACSLLSIVCMAAVMQLLINVERPVASLAQTTAITLASNSWSTSIPGGPAVSAWLTFRVQRSWGATAGVCGWFFVVSGALSTVWLVVIGVSAVFFLGASLSVSALAGSLVVAVATTLALYWATRHPTVLKRWVSFVPERVRGRLISVIDEVSRIRMSASRFGLTAVFSLLNRLFDLAVLYFAVWAVAGTAPTTTAGLNETTLSGVTLAFVMTKLAGAAQVTPGGVGTVEAIAAAALVAGGMTLIDATAATLIYRAISFALVTAIGWVVYLAAYAGRGHMLGRPAQ